MWRTVPSLILALLLLSFSGSVSAFDPSMVVVSDIPGQSTSTLASAQTDGETVVWVERSLGREKGGRAYMADLSTLEPIQVTSESVFEIVINQGIVVWSGSETDSTTGSPIDFNVKGIDLERGTQYDFSTPNHDQLFGYPISEEFVDPETGLTTQYFERAVFEHHPDSPDPYKMLLRRLGAEEIDNRAW